MCDIKTPDRLAYSLLSLATSGRCHVWERVPNGPATGCLAVHRPHCPRGNQGSMRTCVFYDLDMYICEATSRCQPPAREKREKRSSLWDRVHYPPRPVDLLPTRLFSTR